MTYYIKTESIQKMLDHGDIITNAMTLNDEFNTSSYIEYEFPDHLAAELFRTGLLHHARTREPWCDHERSLLRESYLKGVDLTKIALTKAGDITPRVEAPKQHLSVAEMFEDDADDDE